VNRIVTAKTGRPTVRIASRELFTVMNDHWQVSENENGLYILQSRDDPAVKLGPIEGAILAGIHAVISELERHLREGR
jgi:hypothetical protein